MKKCSECKDFLSLDNFPKNKSRKDGHSYICKACTKSRYEKNKEKVSIAYKKYYRLNKKKINTQRGVYLSKRYQEDRQFRILVNAKMRVSNFLKGKKMASKSLGCTQEELKKHLESQFLFDMTWDNYGNGDGKWNIDHIHPLSVAIVEGPESFAKACHYTNLQPMWSSENIKKSNKVA
jgi:hypothetical protein